MDWYVVINNNVTSITDIDAYKEYLINHNGQAPPISEGVCSISESLFKNIDGIFNIYIPYSVKSLSRNLFVNNKDVVINYADYYDLIVREITPNKERKLNYKLISINNSQNFKTFCETHNGQNPEIPLGVESIADYVFKDNLELKKLRLPVSVICMCKQACANCVNLESVELSNNFIDFGEEIFLNCKAMKEIVIPRTIKIMRANVFAGCSNELIINLFNQYTFKNKEFLLQGDLRNHENILAMNFVKLKTLRTNNYLIIFNEEDSYSLSKTELNKMSGFDKHLGIVNNSYNNVFLKFKGEELLKFYEESKKYKIPLPNEIVICNIKLQEIDYYYKRYKIMDKMLSQIRNISNICTCNAQNIMVKRLSKMQYIIILRLMIISGFFNKEGCLEKSINFILKSLFNINNNGKSLVLNLDDLCDIFISFYKNEDNYSYNKEFSEYFLFDFGNLKKMIEVIKTKQKDPSFLYLLLSNCGESGIHYLHNGVLIKSHGLLHDKWINYKENNNDKQKNDGRAKENNVMPFINWALKYGDGSHIFLNLDCCNKQLEMLKPFMKFYFDKSSFEKLNDIFIKSKEIFPFALYPLDNRCFKIKNLICDVSKANSAHIVQREMNAVYSNNSEITEQYIQMIAKELQSSIVDGFYARVIEKNDPIVAYANCEMGHCANINANGCEYLYESYIANNCQPFLIFEKTEYGSIPVASFRIDIDLNSNMGTITCLEVKREVKFLYSNSKKKSIVKVFDDVISRFVKLYELYFHSKMKLITMGQITHCDINDILSEFYSIQKGPFKSSQKRKVVSPSEYNHFIVYKSLDKE